MSFIFVIIAFIWQLFLPHTVLLAQDQSVSDLESKIVEYTKKLEELGKSKDTLANQIKIITSQIDLTLLKISQTEYNVSVLVKEISSLSVKIADLDVYLNQLSSAYIEQVAQNYKLQKRVPSFLFFSDASFNSWLERSKYITLIQKNSQDTLLNLETTRTNYDLQKQEKERKQKELEDLEIKLDGQKKSLASQKSSKSNLLAVTKNDEARYQQLKRAAESELSSLLAAKFVGKRNVKKGEALGMMGNTGYSFGDHLHFGLYGLREENLSSWTYTNDIDASDYLKNQIWPMSDPIEITQGRGQTKYSYLYADKFHHGIDMVSPNKTIKAVNDGVAYFFRNAQSSLGNHVKLFHPDGKMSLYLHMQ